MIAQVRARVVSSLARIAAIPSVTKMALKLVHKALNHRDVKTTLRYAHVLDEEVAEALEKVQTGSRQGKDVA